MSFTGTILQLENNLTEAQTKMVWISQGPITGVYTRTTTLHSLPNLELSDLWDLENLGIWEPSEQISKQSWKKKRNYATIQGYYLYK